MFLNLRFGMTSQCFLEEVYNCNVEGYKHVQSNKLINKTVNNKHITILLCHFWTNEEEDMLFQTK